MNDAIKHGTGGESISSSSPDHTPYDDFPADEATERSSTPGTGHSTPTTKPPESDKSGTANESDARDDAKSIGAEEQAADTEPDQPSTWARLRNIASTTILPTLSRIWSGRPGAARIILYIVTFALVNSAAVVTLQMSAYTEENAKNTYEFIARMWELGHFQPMFNFLLTGMIYALLVFLINRFWTATALFSIFIGIASVANYFKTLMRNEPIIPADLTFLKGNTGEILSFMPDGYGWLVKRTIGALALICLICLMMHLLDKPKYVLPMKRLKAVFIPLRIAIVAILVFSLCFIGGTLGVQDSWTRKTAASVFGDSPALWSVLEDAQKNGPLVNFTRLLYSKAMDKPEGYSEETMKDLAARYRKAANAINRERGNDMADSTVVMLLSESFSDPNRVPGLNFTVDPMPNIRELKQNTTSGLMLSPGYGGGTANIEFQALTGLSLANFDPSMAVPYQQLVPKLKWASSFNQIWNENVDGQASIAMHPYHKNMYLRDTNYKKFGFSKFLTLDEPNVIKHQDKLGKSPYVSDEQSYQNILDSIRGQKKGKSQFIQMVTMQNHMPYTDWYPDNEFFNTDIDTSGLPDKERYLIDTYTKGIQITDQATQDFLDQLNQLDKPVTVIFYGDHLPGIYPTADADKSNSLKLHETDYFIWSNNASGDASRTKISNNETAYTSSNYFMSLAAEHMDAKVSPYLAMLTRLRNRIPAMSALISNAGGIGLGKATYLDKDGNQIDPETMDQKTQQLLADYKLVQYDMTIGKGYLKELGFTTVPE